MNDPYTTRRPKPNLLLWAAYEAKNAAAADEYEARKRRNGLPGCAGGCGTAVHTEGRTCVVCQVRR